MKYKQFESILNALEQQQKHDNKCAEAFQTVFSDSYLCYYDNHYLEDVLLEVVKEAMQDNHKDSWIEYYIYELDFGKKYKKGCASDKDGNINLSNPKYLWKFLNRINETSKL